MSEHDDPFAAFGSDRTVIKPSGGRTAGGPAGGAPASGGSHGAAVAAPAGSAGAGAASGMGQGTPMALDAMMQGSLNPLVAAAVPLLVAAPRIRHMTRHPNPMGLREALGDGINKFEAQARKDGLPNEQIVAGRYILCTFLDESAASTPWGGSGVWSGSSLLVQYHNEAWGGEKVFQLLSRLAQDIKANRNLLELLYLVLALGLEGRFKVLDNGRSQLDGIRQRLAQMLQQGQNGDRALSPRWQGAQPTGGGLTTAIPIWLILLATLLLLGLVFGGLRLSLTQRAEPVFTALQALDTPVAQVTAAPAAPAPVRLAGLLRAEIDGGLLQVQDFADRSVVTLRGDSFFDPGSDEISGAVRPVLPAIARALSQLPGQISIAGHTDNQPIHTLRFPSNWHLSQARAEAVRAQLATLLPPARLRAEGKGDGSPVADNGNPAGRARNRRVEITLFVQADH